MKEKLTLRQAEILEFIENFIADNAYPPTYREIGRQFDILSTFGVKRHLDALIKKGYLNFESNSSRTLSLNYTSKKKNIKEEESSEIPLLGKVAAGYPVFSEENIEGNIRLDSSFFKGDASAYFALRVKGDSMKDAGILENDIVMVNSKGQAKNGSIVVAMINGDATLKTYSRKGNKIYLLPENQNYKPIEINISDDFSIVGIVTGIYRLYN